MHAIEFMIDHKLMDVHFCITETAGSTKGSAVNLSQEAYASAYINDFDKILSNTHELVKFLQSLDPRSFDPLPLHVM